MPRQTNPLDNHIGPKLLYNYLLKPCENAGGIVKTAIISAFLTLSITTLTQQKQSR